MSNRIEIVAEMSANHGNDINIAKETIRMAKEVGADAIKMQTYRADTITLDCDNEFFRIDHGTLWDGVTLYELYQKAYTPWEWHKELFEYAQEIGIEIFSTPFDPTAVDLLEELNVKRYKIASLEINDIPLIRYVASKGKPVILSVGIATLEEIGEAVEACRGEGNDDITLLQCTSQYPAKPEDSNLLVINDMKARFHVKVGVSDHTMSNEVAKIATSMQAVMIEKHFIVDRSIGGADASFSMDAKQFKTMVKAVRKTERIMGRVTYEMDENKRTTRKFARSLFVVENVEQGESITRENVKSIRPGYGISPKFLDEILGKKFSSKIKRGTPMGWNLLK